MKPIIQCNSVKNTYMITDSMLTLIVMSVPTVKALTINTLYGSVWLTQESKQTFQAQGEWELLSINMTNYNATFIWGVKNQLIYQVQGTGYGV